MSSVAEASELLRRVAGQPKAGEKVKGLIRTAARRLKWNHSRTKDVWYEDARRIDSTEMDRLREEAAAVEREEAIAGLVALRDGLAKVNPNKNRKAIAAIDGAIREMGGALGTVGIRKNRPRSKQQVNAYRGA